MIPMDDMHGLGGDETTSAALDAALADLMEAETFTVHVRADVELALAEVATAYEVGSWSVVFPSSHKTFAERREHVEFVRDAANLEPHGWVNTP